MPRSTKKTAPPPSLALTANRILYEDAVLIAVNKPPGFPCHQTHDPKRDHVTAALQRFLQARDGASPKIALQHRLDRDTSGVLLFSKDPSVNPSLNDAFRERRIGKVYLAVVVLRPGQAPPPQRWTIQNFLARDKKNKQRMTAVRGGGDTAITEFQRLSQQGNRLIIEARPKTGRTHQIRVHLAQTGHAILGDTLYGGPEHNRYLLHAWQLCFEHPVSGETITIRAPKPKPFRGGGTGQGPAAS
ncbi:pseudouridine synthase [Acanthopleuribacter pedis]|uniref:RluA family pseudouridine synthase n=1 Tax=Acanthopleuribacter pedis TaxID=442870 RepID=A0A8J7QEY2_9BACT|nr:RluA family pseudouridine synthase [Acanthopleuribacter pedis]